MRDRLLFITFFFLVSATMYYLDRDWTYGDLAWVFLYSVFGFYITSFAAVVSFYLVLFSNEFQPFIEINLFCTKFSSHHAQSHHSTVDFHSCTSM